MKTRFVRHNVGPSCGEAPHGGNNLSVIQRGTRIRLDCFVTGILPDLGLHFCEPEKAPLSSQGRGARPRMTGMELCETKRALAEPDERLGHCRPDLEPGDT